jgi:chromate transporter
VTPSVQKPGLAELTRVFFKIGNTTFGGGTPTIAALQRELVERKNWLSPEDYGLAFSLSRVTPGTNVIAFCAAAGSRILGFPGAAAGALAETAPSAILAVLMTQGYESWRTNPWVLAGVAATVAAVVGMMWSSVVLLVKPHFKGAMPAVRALVIAFGAFALLHWGNLSPLAIIAIAAVVGLLWAEPAKV